MTSRIPEVEHLSACPGQKLWPPKTGEARIPPREAKEIYQSNETVSLLSLHSVGKIGRFFFFITLLLGCFFISACENDEAQINAWTGKKVMVEEGKTIEAYLSQESKVRAKLTAPLMLRYEADTIYLEFPKSLHVDFYDDSARIETRLDSKHGKYFENLNKVYLWDSVIVINVQGDTLKSSDLWWDMNTRLFYTEKYAEYRTKDKQIYPGKGLEATQDFQRITFKQPTGTVQVSDKNMPL